MIVIVYEILCSYLGRHISGAFSSYGKPLRWDTAQRPFHDSMYLWPDSNLRSCWYLWPWLLRFLTGQSPALYTREPNQSCYCSDESAFSQSTWVRWVCVVHINVKVSLTFLPQMHCPLSWCLHLRMSSFRSHYWKLLILKSWHQRSQEDPRRLASFLDPPPNTPF